LHLVGGTNSGGIEDIQIGSPVMSTAPRQRGPQQNGLYSLRRRQPQAVDRYTGSVIQGPLAAELGIPNGELPIEIAKATDGHEVKPRGTGRMAQFHEGRDRVHMQQTGRIG
jgi:hypothetical protein